MSISYWLDRSSEYEKRSFDIVIVGAGIAGCSAAYWLKKEDPSLKVAIIDRGELAFGATGRNAGFITCGSVEHFNRLVERWGDKRAYEIWKFSETNLELLRQEILETLPENERQKLGFNDAGTFSLASSVNEFAELRKTAELMGRFGIGVEILEAEAIRRRLGVEEFVGGVKYLDDASVHPVALCQAIFEKSKAQLFPHTEVIAIEETSEGLRRIRTNRGDFEAAAVVLALNGYLPTVHRYFEDKIFPTRGQIMVTEKVAPFMEGPCYANFVLDYFRQLPTGEVIIGGFRQLEKATEVGYSDHTTQVIQQALYDFLQKHIPILRGKKITHRWAGVMGFSVDGQPQIGALPTDSQIYFLGGFTAHGLGLAFHGSKCLVDLIYGREIPAFVSAKRF